MASMMESEATLIGNPMLWWAQYAVRHGWTLRRIRANGEDRHYVSYFLFDNLIAVGTLLFIAITLVL